MAWSINRTDTAANLLAQAKNFYNQAQALDQPQQNIAMAVGALLTNVLIAMPQDRSVQVIVNGSQADQADTGDANRIDKVITLTVSITPQ